MSSEVCPAQLWEVDGLCGRKAAVTEGLRLGPLRMQCHTVKPPYYWYAPLVVSCYPATFLLNCFLVCSVPTLPTLQPVNTGCPPGYSHHRSNCYKFVPTPTQWAAARAACQREGGDLATLTNRFQLALLTLLRMPDRQHVRNVTDIWIGLTMPQVTPTGLIVIIIIIDNFCVPQLTALYILQHFHKHNTYN